jgi:hypothetical protein
MWNLRFSLCEYLHCILLGYDAMYYCTWLPTFWRNISPPSSGKKWKYLQDYIISYPSRSQSKPLSYPPSLQEEYLAWEDEPDELEHPGRSKKPIYISLTHRIHATTMTITHSFHSMWTVGSDSSLESSQLEYTLVLTVELLIGMTYALCMFLLLCRHRMLLNWLHGAESFLRS